MLLVGDRVVLRASAPPEAEYAMFELEEIELRSSEHGRVREHGYQTTVEQALARLANLGATVDLARECCALHMIPVLVDAYARGAAARHVARYLGPLEVFQSDAYDGASHLYQGTFLDLPALTTDLGLPQASGVMQALYLATLLSEEKPDVTVFLQTEAWTKQRKPGERTFKRPNLGALKEIAAALGELGMRRPTPQITGALPRADVMAFIRARADAATDQDARDLYASLERGIATREMPDKGPLADPELWTIEARLDSGALDGIMSAVEAVEHSRGRTPGTTYLRARASLALHLEPPKLVAERVSALALSMTSFQELALLAAEAWLDAGEPRRAMPYARDLVDAPAIDEGLLLKAQRVLARAVGAAPTNSRRSKTIADSMPAGPMAASQRPPRQTMSPPLAPPDPESPRSYAPGSSRVPTVKGGMLRPPTSPGIGIPQPPAPPTEPPPASKPPPRSARESRKPAAPSLRPGERKGSLPPLSPPKQKPGRASVLPGAGPPPLDLELTPPPMNVGNVGGASFTLDMPAPDAEAPRPSSVPPAEARPSRAPRVVESRRPSRMPDPRAEPETEAEAADAKLTTRKPARGDEPRPSKQPPKSQPPSDPTRPAVERALIERSAKPDFDDEVTAPRGHARTAIVEEAERRRELMLGASLPPFQTEDPAPLLPRAPLLPKIGPSDELAEHLSLPPGVSTDVELTSLPRSILEARVHFTLLARELGLDYRLKRGIELRADIRGIEAMQAVLLEMFPDHVVKTKEEAYEVRRHGAVLAEILARSLDAEWLDISPGAIGRWAMIVPPNTRVWPFGRVARLIQMGHKERDLVSYYLELKSRTAGR